jgi:hypothetical protein
VLNSDGMGIKLTKDGAGASALEYEVIGGILDFYFFAGNEIPLKWRGNMQKLPAWIQPVPIWIPEYVLSFFLAFVLGP